MWSEGETVTPAATTDPALPLCHDFTPHLFLAKKLQQPKELP